MNSQSPNFAGSSDLATSTRNPRPVTTLTRRDPKTKSPVDLRWIRLVISRASASGVTLEEAKLFVHPLLIKLLVARHCADVVPEAAGVICADSPLRLQEPRDEVSHEVMLPPPLTLP